MPSFDEEREERGPAQDRAAKRSWDQSHCEDEASARTVGMAGLNTKILCLVDEHGTPGEDGFAFGCVMVWSRECGKAFSDLLPPSVNEVHAAT